MDFIRDATKAGSELVSKMPERFLGGNISDLVDQVNAQASKLKGLKNSIASPAVAGLLKAAAGNTGFMDVLAKINMSAIKEKAIARLEGMMPGEIATCRG